jgi:hypothetical protein
MTVQNIGSTIHDRLRQWRQEVLSVSQAKLCQAVNSHLPEADRVAVTTVSNYERTTEPRGSFLAALKRAYPEINLEWLIAGEGKVLVGEQRTAEALRHARTEEGHAEVTVPVMEQPGMQRFRGLPEPAVHVLVAFLEEVRQSNPEYRSEHSRTWRDFLQRFSHFFFEPFQSTRHFSSRPSLSDDDLTNYTLSLIAALRPLVLAIRAREKAQQLTPVGTGPATP